MKEFLCYLAYSHNSLIDSLILWISKLQMYFGYHEAIKKWMSSATALFNVHFARFIITSLNRFLLCKSENYWVWTQFSFSGWLAQLCYWFADTLEFQAPNAFWLSRSRQEMNVFCNCSIYDSFRTIHYCFPQSISIALIVQFCKCESELHF